LRNALEKKIAGLRRSLGALPEEKRPSLYRVMSLDPPATIGGDSFQTDLFSLAGGKNVFADVKKDFFKVDAAELIKRNPDVIVVCGDDEAGARKKLRESPVYDKLAAVKNGSVLVIPCDLTCRPGPRVVETAERIARRLHRDTLSGKPQ
ncbi:MAG TPA: ABC transporter substrate-binding protein, partial [Nitrospirota bacterium]